MSEPAPSCVLIVKVDGTIVANGVEYLESRRFAVGSAHDGTAPMARLASDTYDEIVLDLGLPRADGLHVPQHLRRRLAVATPVLVATARDALASKAEAFSLGADDYVVKPFALAEIDLRIRALHRRARRRGRGRSPRGPLALDRRTREVRVDGASLKIAPRNMQILELLLQDPGRVFTRAEQHAALWPDGPPASESPRSGSASRAAQPASHDDLFNSVLDLLAVVTPCYLPQRDVFAACRSSRFAAPATER